MRFLRAGFSRVWCRNWGFNRVARRDFPRNRTICGWLLSSVEYYYVLGGGKEGHGVEGGGARRKAERVLGLRKRSRRSRPD